MTRLRKIVRWLLRLGWAPALVVAALVSRGVDEEVARDLVREVRADHHRATVDSTATERILIAVPAAQEAAANADAARLLCGPDVDGGDPAHDDCIAAESKTFSLRLCRISNGAHVATTSGGISLTPNQWARVRDERDPAISYTVVRPEQPLADLLAERGWRRCEVGP